MAYKFDLWNDFMAYVRNAPDEELNTLQSSYAAYNSLPANRIREHGVILEKARRTEGYDQLANWGLTEFEQVNDWVPGYRTEVEGNIHGRKVRDETMQAKREERVAEDKKRDVEEVTKKPTVRPRKGAMAGLGGLRIQKSGVNAGPKVGAGLVV